MMIGRRGFLLGTAAVATAAAVPAQAAIVPQRLATGGFITPAVGELLDAAGRVIMRATAVYINVFDNGDKEVRVDFPVADKCATVAGWRITGLDGHTVEGAEHVFLTNGCNVRLSMNCNFK